MARNPLRIDPSRTTLLRRQFQGQMQARFHRLRSLVWRAVVTEDALGLVPRPAFVVLYDPDQPRDEQGRWTDEGGGIPSPAYGSREGRLSFPVRAGVKESFNLGFGQCTQLAMSEHKQTGAEVWVGTVVRRDRLLEYEKAFAKDGTIIGSEAIPHAWNIEDGEIVDKSLGSKVAETHIYFGFRVPDDVLNGIEDGDSLAKWHVNHRDVPTANYDPNQPRDEQGRWTDEGGGTTSTARDLLLKKDKLERSAVFDKEGVLIGPVTVGSEEEVGFTQDIRLDKVGSEMVHHHTHPFEAGPSMGDVLVLANHPGLSEIQVHTPGTTYVVTKTTDDNRKLYYAAKDAYSKADIRSIDEYLETGRKKTHEEHWGGMSKEALEELQKQGLVQYRVIHFPTTNAPPGRKAFEFHTLDQKLRYFNKWFQEQVDNDVLEVARTTRPWLSKFVESAYKKGAIRAYVDSHQPELGKSQDFYLGSREQFLRSAFETPERVSKLRLLGTRAFEELRGISAEMSRQVSRVLADGLANGKGPYEMARTMSKTISGIERKRANVLARTEIIHAHAEGQLDAFEDLGVEEVGLLAEWLTAGDDLVCPDCEAMEGEVMTVDEARGRLPLHPNCRCAWIPAGVGEGGRGRKFTRAAKRLAMAR